MAIMVYVTDENGDVMEFNEQDIGYEGDDKFYLIKLRTQRVSTVLFEEYNSKFECVLKMSTIYFENLTPEKLYEILITYLIMVVQFYFLSKYFKNDFHRHLDQLYPEKDNN
jgi:hypothetical protein